MTDPKCNKCHRKKAKCVSFLIDVCRGTKTQIDSVDGGMRMHMCLDCAERELDPAIYVGILKKTAALDYVHHVRMNDADPSISHQFLDNGIVVIDPTKDSSAQEMLSFLKTILN